MKKIRKKITREKIVVMLYQYILTQIDQDEARSFLEHDEAINDPKFKDSKEEEIVYCLDTFSKIRENYDVLYATVGKNLKQGWKMDRLSKMEQAILLNGCFELQVLENDKTVVINESVELSKKFCDDQSYKFINGVLNKI